MRHKLCDSVILLLIISLFLICQPAFAANWTDEAVFGNNRWSVTSGGDLIPGSNVSYDIGSPTYQVSEIYASNVNATVGTIGAISLTGNITPNASHVRNIGSATYEIGGIYADGATLDSLTTGSATITTASLGATSLTGNITPSESHTKSIGTSTYEIGGIYADGATLDSLTTSGGSANGMTIGAVTPSTGSFTTLAYSGVLSPGANSSALASYEIFTTGDTLTATDSGKYIITNLADADGIVDFVLPAATTPGLEYKFVSEAASIIRIDPAANASTDHILFASLDAGDRIASGTAVAADGASGDSITLISTGTGWAVFGVNPDNTTWVDAN